eukprot:7033971-Prymnesium_polylepis.1
MSVDEAMELVESHPERYSGFIVDSGNDQGVFLCAQGGTLAGPENGVPPSWTAHMLSSGDGEQRSVRKTRAVRSRKKGKFKLGGLLRKKFTPWGGLALAAQAFADAPRLGLKKALPKIESAGGASTAGTWPGGTGRGGTRAPPGKTELLRRA